MSFMDSFDDHDLLHDDGYVPGCSACDEEEAAEMNIHERQQELAERRMDDRIAAYKHSLSPINDQLDAMLDRANKQMDTMLAFFTATRERDK